MSAKFYLQKKCYQQRATTHSISQFLRQVVKSPCRCLHVIQLLSDLTDFCLVLVLKSSPPLLVIVITSIISIITIICEFVQLLSDSSSPLSLFSSNNNNNDNNGQLFQSANIFAKQKLNVLAHTIHAHIYK